MTSTQTLACVEEDFDVRRVCILTGGGDAPGLNAVLRAFVKTALELEIEVLGSEDGFAGLIDEPARIVALDKSKVEAILPQGGSILGCSNQAHPFAFPTRAEDGSKITIDVSGRVKARLEALEIDVLVLVGGDGTMSIGSRFADMGVPVIGIPKTIDNDLAATDMSFGLDTAVRTATWAIDTLHSTAESHDRVMIVEVMGRDAGWIALHAGLAGGAHVILIPEIPYDVDRVIAKIKKRSAYGRVYSIIVIGEGSKPAGGTVSTITAGRTDHPPRLGGAGEHLCDLLKGQVDHDLRVTVLGHLQRGGSPTAFDRLLGTRFGVRAAQMCRDGIMNRVVVLHGTEVSTVPIEATVGRHKRVPTDGELIRVAKALQIEIGR